MDNSIYTPEKILITGASGFVGSALCKDLMSRNFRIRTASRSSIAPLQGVEHSSVPIIDGATDWSQALVDVDVIIHLAARVHMMQDGAENPLEEFLKVNLNGTVNLAQQAARSGVKRFVYVSSIKVNGESTHNADLRGADRGRSVFRESDSPYPQDSYAISKWEAEQVLQTISRETGMESVTVRPPLVYGPGVKANFAKLLHLMDIGIPLPLGNVQNSRSLVYVGNMTDALIVCALHPAAAGQVYLISDGEDVSTLQLINSVARALNCSSRIFPMSITLMRAAAKLVGKSAAVDRLTQSLVIDSSKIRRELGWQPPYTMSQGLQITADWYRSDKAGRGA